jgi:tetratricopeptide (TPR) repeat protein
MRSCIFLFYLAASAVALHPSTSRAQAADPDRLYENRADLPSARRAADLFRDALAANPTFDTAWKLSRTDYWLGGHAPEAERRKFFEEGIASARKAISIAPDRPEGHFWLAANMGTMAESFGLRAGLKYRKPVKEALETVLRIDPAFGEGAADRALGRWYDKVPGLFGGSNKLAEEHLKAALKYDPNSTVTHYFLADLYADTHRTAEARAEAQKVLDAPINPRYAPEDRDWKAKAERLLRTLR